MLRIALILAALGAFPAAGLAARRADAPAAPGPVTKVVACDVTGSARTATFFARMDTIAGASKMQIRFQVLERLGRTSSWTKLDLPSLRQWHTSAAGVNRYAWRQTVDGLHVGGAYRAHVTYRWLSASGAVLDTDTRDSSACHGPLPNIVVGDLSQKPGPTADTRTYRVDVSNQGKVAADQVDVQLAVDKAVLDTVTLNELAAGETRSVSFTGPPCSHGVRVTADPDNSIGESFENDNAQRFACP